MNNIYRFLLDSIKKIFCKHDFKYWKMRFISNRESLNNVEMIRWRECQSCGKKQELNRTPGNWKWVRTGKELPINTDTIDVNVYLVGEESKSDKRDKLIDSILSK